MLKEFKIPMMFFVLLLCVGCATSLDSEQELLKWMSDTDNGFVKKSKTNGFLLTMKYMPPEYLAINEYSKDEGNGSNSYTDYLSSFSTSRTFLLTITHDDESVDASKYGVTNMSDYSERIKELSFNMKESLVLKTSSGKKYKPVLTTMENLYEIGNRKSIHLVFSDDTKDIFNSEKLDVVFQDTFLDTGITHFVFDSKKIDNVPQLNFLKQ